MEQNLPIITKKIWKIIRVLYFMLRKGISKGKLLADLSTILKRGKIAGKAAMHNLMFHHHHHPHDRRHVPFPATALNEYEFSCSNSPSFHLPFHLNKRKHSSHAPPPHPIDEETMAAALEIISIGSASASPPLPGFGPSPLVRQLRITDSPFPLRDVEEDSRVDEAAEQFIMKFYKDLRKQNSRAYLGYS